MDNTQHDRIHHCQGILQKHKAARPVSNHRWKENAKLLCTEAQCHPFNGNCKFIHANKHCTMKTYKGRKVECLRRFKVDSGCAWSTSHSDRLYFPGKEHSPHHTTAIRGCVHSRPVPGVMKHRNIATFPPKIEPRLSGQQPVTLLTEPSEFKFHYSVQVNPLSRPSSTGCKSFCEFTM
jgi:hypothetical protein